MMILVTTSRRQQKRYDHRLRGLVRGTGNMTIATELCIRWLQTPKVVVSLDATNLTASELQEELVALG